MISKNSIEISNVNKSFGSKKILNDLLMTIKSSERYVLLGSNGSGKTTLAKLLTTLNAPDTGKILLNGNDSIKDAEYIRSFIGYVGHNSLLYGDLNAYDNLRFFSNFYPKFNFKKQFDYLSHLLNLSHLINQKVNKLSHGERKRVSIMKAMITNPSILIMDEPDAGLDSNSLDNLRNSFFPDLVSRNITVFMTTHNTELAISIASVIGILHQGQIRFETRATNQFLETISKYKSMDTNQS